MEGLIAALILSAAAAAGMLMEFDQLFLDYYTDSFVLEFLWGILAFYLIRLWEKYGRKAVEKDLLCGGDDVLCLYVF